MKENLRVSRYNNGELISRNVPTNQWHTTYYGLCTSYNNQISNEIPHGKLYNWYAVSDSRKLCPIGWHVPTDTEFNTLIGLLGGATSAGGKLKQTGTAYWLSPNTGATNHSNFSALGSGRMHYQSGEYDLLLQQGLFWARNQFPNDPSISFSLTVENISAQTYIGGYQNYTGLSVRCLKD
jgi:uncharacterized protein (TIGR02145 family)